MKYLSILLLIGAGVILGGCTDEEANITKTVVGFFESVSTGDLDTVSKHFPGLASLSKPEREAYITVFAGFDRWEVVSVAIEGSSAVAAVEVATGDEGITIQLPLIYENKRWIITERTSMRAKIDVVPAG